MKNKIDNGVHWFDNKEDEKNITEVQRKLMESQDLNYIRLNLQKEQKKVAKLEDQLRMTAGTSRPKCHIVFGFKASKSSQEFLKGGEMSALKCGYSNKELGKMKKELNLMLMMDDTCQTMRRFRTSFVHRGDVEGIF